MEKHTIESLAKKSDAELAALLGQDRQLDKFKQGLADAAELKGKTRERVEEGIQQMLTPHVYPEEISHMVASAKRKEQSGKEAMADCCPCSVID